jgi:hypothetical protein
MTMKENWNARIKAARIEAAAKEEAAGAARETSRNGSARAAAPTSRVIQLRPLASVEPRTVRWLKPNTIPRGALTLVAGLGGLGKSTLLMAVAAECSRGELLDGSPGDVILVSFEDAAAEILRPRAEAAGADLARIHDLYVDARAGEPLTLPGDLTELGEVIAGTNARLVVIDPIVAALDLRLDAYKDQHVRSVLAELAAIAEESECAVVMVGHLVKGQSASAYVRIANSVAFYNAARSVLVVTGDRAEPEEQRLLTQVKTNWGRFAPIERHRIEETQLETLDRTTGKPIVTSRMRFLEHADDVDRNDVLSERDRREGGEKTSDAVAFVTDALKDGAWHDSAGLKKLAAAQHISERSLQRAAEALGLQHERRGFPASTHWRRAPVAPTVPTRFGATVARLEQPHNQAVSRPASSQSRRARGDGATGGAAVAPGDYDALVTRRPEAGS